jgi:hypothetical protein
MLLALWLCKRLIQPSLFNITVLYEVSHQEGNKEY